MKLWLSILALSYLLGSIPFGYLLVLIFRKEDVRATGSGNIGATNVARSGGKSMGILTLLLDCAKAFAAVAIAKHLAPGNFSIATVAALAAVLGHVFPVWLGFHGGKGIASALGVYLALSWPTALCALGVFILVLLITRYVSLGSILGAATLPVFFMLFVSDHTPVVIGCVLFISLLTIVKHRANIARLKSGTESKLGGGKQRPVEAGRA